MNNEIEEINESTIGIVVYSKGERFVCLVDKEDYPRVSGFKWHLSGISKTNSTRYARAHLCNKGPDRGMTIFMHRLIMSFPVEGQVDHVNRNGLDNRMKNLRKVSQLENARNKVYKKKSKSGFIGVAICTSAEQPWRASIWHDGKSVYIGNFKTREDAALAYDAKAVELRGEFAVLNFPHELPANSMCG